MPLPTPTPPPKKNHWALLRRTVVTFDDDPGSTYLARLRIVETPLFGLYLHRFGRPDASRHLHNHPWPFGSLVLRGGYSEVVAADFDHAVTYAKDGSHSEHRHWRPGSWHRITMRQFHTIAVLDAVPTWTLLFVGRRRTGWGFATEEGFVDHLAYERRGVTVISSANRTNRPQGEADVRYY